MAIYKYPILLKARALLAGEQPVGTLEAALDNA